MVELARCLACRTTSNSHSLASAGVQVLLALEEPRSGTTEDRLGNPTSASPDVPRQSAVGRTSNPWRTAEVGVQIVRGYRFQVHDSPQGPPSETWQTFLRNHLKETVSVDFFTVPTATFRILFVFGVLSNDRRKILHFNATEHPTAQWTGRQLVNACGWDSNPRYPIRDRDGSYGTSFQRQAQILGIEEIVASPASPWQNAYAERVIESIRRECLDHVVVLGERHLKRILSDYAAYCNGVRTHLSLGKDAPDGRETHPNERGRIVSLKRVGGLHHEYVRIAA